MSTLLIVKEGKDLTIDELKTINYWRKKEFISESTIQPKSGDDDWNKKYLLLHNENNKLVAFARLHEVQLDFLGKKYHITGLATLISTIRSKGYGKELLLQIKKYVKRSGKTGIGFCNRKLTEFYRKFEFGIIEDGALRFQYQDSEGHLFKDPWGGGDVVFIKGSDDLIKKMITNPRGNMIIHRKHW